MYNFVNDAYRNIVPLRFTVTTFVTSDDADTHPVNPNCRDWYRSDAPTWTKLPPLLERIFDNITDELNTTLSTAVKLALYGDGFAQISVPNVMDINIFVLEKQCVNSYVVFPGRFPAANEPVGPVVDT
jgi:hypothetical protein